MRAINFEAMVQANRELLLAQETEEVLTLEWVPTNLAFTLATRVATKR